MDDKLKEQHWNGAKNKDTEEWLPVVGYEGLYSVSNLDRRYWKHVE